MSPWFVLLQSNTDECRMIHHMFRGSEIRNAWRNLGKGEEVVLNRRGFDTTEYSPNGKSRWKAWPLLTLIMEAEGLQFTWLFPSWSSSQYITLIVGCPFFIFDIFGQLEFSVRGRANKSAKISDWASICQNYQTNLDAAIPLLRSCNIGNNRKLLGFALRAFVC